MKVTETAVRRGVTFAMIYLIAVGFGLFSLARLKLDLFPKLEFPVIALITQYTGVGPFDMETVVTRPIEETVAIVENVKKITSQSAQGISLVSLEFEWGTDMNQAEIDVRNAIEWVRDVLPDDVSEPLVFAFDVSMQPIIYFSVTSQVHGAAELRKISEHEIEPRIERIPGVASAATSGGMAREIKILVDPLRLRAYNLSIQQVTQALQMNNLQLPSGYIENERQEFSIQTSGEYASVEEIENTSIMAMNGVNIRIKDVANVVDGFKEERQRIWSNGVPSVMLWIQRQSDANTVQVCRDVIAAVPKIESELPRGVTLELFYDSSTFIERSMSNLGTTAIQAIILAFIVLLFFLGNIRTSTIVALSIPISIIVTFAVMDQAGLTLNVISMAGLALAVGLLVDNSIVVVESIYRFREDGEKPADAANKGTGEVAMAITASTLTTLSVFLPVLFVPGLAGQLFKEMVITICFSLAVSLIVALTLIPLLASRFLKLATKDAPKNVFRKLAARTGRAIERLKDNYAKRLNWSLHHRKTVLFSVLGMFIVSIMLMGALGGEFMPEGDDGFLAISVDRTPGISLDQMEKTMREINDILDEYVPEGEYTYSSFGQGEGILAFFSSRSAAEGDINVRLKSLTQRQRSEDDIKAALRDKFTRIPDATITFSDRGEAAMTGSAGDIVVLVIGHDLDLAEALANDIKNKIDEIEGVVFTELSVKEARPELRINLDRNRIADLGLSTAQVGQTVSTSILGSVVTRYREGGDEYDVRVQLDKDSRESKEDIENILVMTPTGRQIPLRAIAMIDYEKSPQEITREDQERFVSINVDIEKNSQLRAITAQVTNILQNTPIPSDYRFEISGTAEDMQESFMYLGLAFLVAIILVYMVMASQFESFVDPFIIIFTIPLALIGVVLGLFVTGTTLSVMALVGIVMLVGIVVNNGIVLVDYINQLRDRGYGLFDAIIEAGRVRMRPVLMTASTTILAMLPLALGLGESGESWAPMARSVMGGLTVATLLTLIVVPVIYASLELSAEKRKAKRVAKKRARMQRKLAPHQA
ncbi:efflux RND transporter permease subunit [candidate division KSB1 bacterium]|nr:efflux RND transporter permease subunit [candidate division KSB1 bacterium]RQV99931.1 MAG: efflux RND transporter permease subunit [candidate division KSB1 bacterium]